MSNTEKITININVVDLGKIDLLVENGFYSNRTDFIKTSIRNKLDTENYIIKDAITKNNFGIGIFMYGKDYLEKKVSANEKLNLKIVGMLVLKDDITPELALKAINSIEVKGILRADSRLKTELSQIIKFKNF